MWGPGDTMHVIAVASQKGGAGKSTLALNLAVKADAEAKPALLIDTDPQASLAVWQRAREAATPIVVPCRPGELDDVLEAARRDGRIEWAFIDAPPQNNEDVAAMMAAATLVLIPVRASVFDLASIQPTIELARSLQASVLRGLERGAAAAWGGGGGAGGGSAAGDRGDGRAGVAAGDRPALGFRAGADDGPRRERGGARRPGGEGDQQSVGRHQPGGARHGRPPGSSPQWNLGSLSAG